MTRDFPPLRPNHSRIHDSEEPFPVWLNLAIFLILGSLAWALIIMLGRGLFRWLGI